LWGWLFVKAFVKLREIAHHTSCPKFREMKT
jgi:hypothetical protein